MNLDSDHNVASGICFASSAIRCRFVETLSELDISDLLSLQQFHDLTSRFPPRGPLGEFPRLVGTIETLLLPIIH